MKGNVKNSCFKLQFGNYCVERDELYKSKVHVIFAAYLEHFY